MDAKISLIRVSPLAVRMETASYAVAIFRRSVARPIVNKNPLSPEGSRIMRLTNSPDQGNKGKADCIHRLISTARASAVAERKFSKLRSVEWNGDIKRAPLSPGGLRHPAPRGPRTIFIVTLISSLKINKYLKNGFVVQNVYS